MRTLAFTTTLAGLMACTVLGGCGSASTPASTARPNAGHTATAPLAGTGKPPVTIGDKNFTEQFVLGELYALALEAQGYTVTIDRNIGPTEVTLQALKTGMLAMYPEYLHVWDASIAGDGREFLTSRAAYQAGQRYALENGYELLDPTPFSDTDAIGVSFNYAAENHLRTIEDLRKLAPSLTFGAAPQFEHSPDGLPAVEQAYGFAPAAFKPLEIGGQYQALDRGIVQAADVATTDGELLSGDYALLKDPRRIFGWGNVVPVVSARVLDAEGPTFASTINHVSALLTLPVIRQLNAAVDLYDESPTVVAKEFLMAHGLLPVSPPGQGS